MDRFGVIEYWGQWAICEKGIIKELHNHKTHAVERLEKLQEEENAEVL